MCTKSLKKWALLLTFWAAVQLSPLRATDATFDSLTVTQSADIQCDALTLGAHYDNTSIAGVQLSYAETPANGTTSSTLEFNASRSANTWLWQQTPTGSTTLQKQMTLDNTNTLTLWDQSSPTQNANIVLNPQGPSTFDNSIEIPNQTSSSIDAYSVLTKGVADSLYISPGIGGSIALNEGSSTGWSAFAEGSMSLASSDCSTAIGIQSTASGHAAIAIGAGATASGSVSVAMGNNTTASGDFSTAMGFMTTASGQGSTAIGRGSTASGNSSMAMGYNSTASGYYSTASGYYTQARGFGSYAIGVNNIDISSTNQIPSPNTWVLTDPLFEIGNGQPTTPGYWTSGAYSSSGYYTWYPPPGAEIAFSSTDTDSGSSYYGWVISYVYPWVPSQYIPPTPPTYSNAFVVYKNGNGVIQGSLSAGGSISTSGDASVQGSLSAGSISTTSLSASSLSTTGNITAPTFLTTAPNGSGDIQMYTGR